MIKVLWTVEEAESTPKINTSTPQHFAIGITSWQQLRKNRSECATYKTWDVSFLVDIINHFKYKVMSDQLPPINYDQPRIYQIRIQGHLNPQWADWFDGLVVSLEENGDTLLSGPVIDQAALYGLLKKVRDLGMPLISVNSFGQIKKQREVAT